MVNSGCSIDNFGIHGTPVKVKGIEMLPVTNCADFKVKQNMPGFENEAIDRHPKKYKVTIEVIVEEFDGY